MKRLFRFWNQARKGHCDALYMSNGTVEEFVDVTAPVAAYRHADVHPSGFREELLILIQHGSYHIGGVHSQPLIDRGETLLYRGVQRAETYLLHRVTTAALRSQLMRVHTRSLTDSVVSFNAVHCNLVRCETALLNDRSFVFDGLCREANLEPDDPARQVRALFRIRAGRMACLAEVWAQLREVPNAADQHPHHDFCVWRDRGVKVLDPNKLDVIEAFGCKVREVLN